MQSKATTVGAYIAELPPDRRTAVEALRKVILANLDDDYEEGVQYGMIAYYVPHSVFPAGYHANPAQPLPFVSIASQKGHLSLYLLGVYCGGDDADEARWFRDAWQRTGKRLDMGKSCVRFRRVEDVALDVVGEAVRRLPARAYIARYQQALAAAKAQRPAAKVAAKLAAKAAAKKPAKKPAKPRSVPKKAAKKAAPAAKKRVPARTT